MFVVLGMFVMCFVSFRTSCAESRLDVSRFVSGFGDDARYFYDDRYGVWRDAFGVDQSDYCDYDSDNSDTCTECSDSDDSSDDNCGSSSSSDSGCGYRDSLDDDSYDSDEYGDEYFEDLSECVKLYNSHGARAGLDGNDDYWPKDKDDDYIVPSKRPRMK